MVWSISCSQICRMNHRSAFAILIAFISLMAASGMAASGSSEARSVTRSFEFPLYFEPNTGQAPPDIRFVARGPNYTIALGPEGATFGLIRPTHDAKAIARPTDILRMRLSNSKGAVSLTGSEKQKADSNYFIGSDPARWLHNVPQFGRVSYTSQQPDCLRRTQRPLQRHQHRPSSFPNHKRWSNVDRYQRESSQPARLVHSDRFHNVHKDSVSRRRQRRILQFELWRYLEQVWFRTSRRPGLPTSLQ
jgi:hypothetical protein